MNDVKCLRVNSVEERNDYRSAIASMLLDIQRENSLTLCEIADKIDVSLGTISNAANKKNDLSPVFMARLAMAYGSHHLGHFAKLGGGRVVALDHGNVADILPMINRAGLKIAEARDPASIGGTRETHSEKLGYLPDLKRLQRELEKLIFHVEGLAA